MALDSQDRAYVVRQATELLKHEHRDRLFDILAARLARGDYPDDREKRLDEITFAIAQAINEQLGAEQA